MKKIALSVVLYLILFGGYSLAFTINETTDFSNFASSPTTLGITASLGVNTVSGHVDYLSGDYYDVFQFQLLPETEISFIEWKAENIVVSDTQYRLALGLISFGSDISIGNDVAGQNIFPPGTSVPQIIRNSDDVYTYPPFDLEYLTYGSLAGASRYQGGWSLYPASSGTSSFDWTYSFTVSPAPVPEPSTFLLLGGGLAGLAFYARRRRKE